MCGSKAPQQVPGASCALLSDKDWTISWVSCSYGPYTTKEKENKINQDQKKKKSSKSDSTAASMLELLQGASMKFPDNT